MPRLFFGIPLPQPLRDRAMAVSSELRRTEVRASWVPAENLHYTLKFLGELPDGKVPGLVEAARAAAAPLAPFTIDVAGVGAFPGARRPRVIWIGGATSCSTATDLARRLDEVGATFGVAPETRPFVLHLTIARLRPDARAPRELADAIERLSASPLGSFSCTGATLWASRLSAGTARHEAVAHLELGG